jgi:polyisoprenoid-binding protein YceI
MARQAAAAVAGSLVIVANGALATEESYTIDPVHSQPIFEVRHMGYSLQRGSFTKLSGKITLDREARKGGVDIAIDTAPIRTIGPRLDAHVKGEDFFDVAKYPTVAFKSSNLIFDGDRVAAVDGELTLLGVTKPVTLKVSDVVCGEHPVNKRPMCGAEATALIKRSEWGMTYGIPRAVGDEVRIIAPIEARRD